MTSLLSSQDVYIVFTDFRLPYMKFENCCLEQSSYIICVLFQMLLLLQDCVFVCYIIFLFVNLIYLHRDVEVLTLSIVMKLGAV